VFYGVASGRGVGTAPEIGEIGEIGGGLDGNRFGVVVTMGVKIGAGFALIEGTAGAVAPALPSEGATTD
jgi:hypothetical protein